ncbi:MAG TPA: hypothetical protein PLN48_15775 [Lachnospiraceae bacterium]|nr:hypothetical protein [Bacteroidales bacterium]HUM85198.1 hypothetical protein [Lachnospiraceae bacterium]
MSVSKIESKIQDLERVVRAYGENNIKLSANGGNSMLFMCPPLEENEYIKAMKNDLDSEKYTFIDLNQLLVKFIDNNHEEIEAKFDLLKNSSGQIFKLPQGEEGNDLFQMIIAAIVEAYDQAKIPVLIRVGALNGTDIENIHIMEDKVVMQGKSPLIILYPAEKKNDEIMFLGIRPASKYRCLVIGGN